MENDENEQDLIAIVEQALEDGTVVDAVTGKTVKKK